MKRPRATEFLRVCVRYLWEDFYGSKNQRTIADKHPWQLSKHSWA